MREMREMGVLNCGKWGRRFSYGSSSLSDQLGCPPLGYKPKKGAESTALTNQRRVPPQQPIAEGLEGGAYSGGAQRRSDWSCRRAVAFFSPLFNVLVNYRLKSNLF